ncbi:MAG: hypothetical protein JXR63_07910 [Spirochaetales bacterium]|nr:hypothetical protein [Spirochaetales bacterium]
MNNKYYYASASLPLLIFGKQSQISEEYFLEICKSNLSESDYSVVTACKFPEFLPEYSKNSVATAYWDFERNLRNELAKMRADKFEIDYISYIREGATNPFVMETAFNAIKQDSPYEAEKILDQSRWDTIENLSVNCFADLNFFASYYIKLQICLRQDSFNLEKGKENYSIAYKQIIGDLDKKFASGEEI